MDERNYVYMVKCADGSLYTGWTNDLPGRLHAHNHGKAGARYTRSRRPVSLFYFECFRTKQEAMRRECEIKKLTRAEKERLAGSGPEGGYYGETCVCNEDQKGLRE